MQRIRWTEYTFSASLILTLVFILWSNIEFTQVTGCFIISMMNIQFGDCHEMLNKGRKLSEINWKSFFYGAFAGIVPWMVLWGLIARVIAKYDVPLDLIPWWVWLFLILYWLLFWCFPILFVAQYK